MYITDWPGRSTTTLSNSFRPYDEQIRRELGLLDNDRRFAYVLYYLPDGLRWQDRPKDDNGVEYEDQYLQAGGTAERMGVELRRAEADGQLRFYVVGRQHDLSEPLTETLDVQSAHEPRHPAELFDADEAARIFHHYFRHRTVPDEYTLRLIDDM
ncbi:MULTISPECIES: hypothetical protein [unclassified Curtobacterium]|uniref:hypothetical protein n=1 Tax=unclassified Curtobacterium TaxID=257496 RepID=UPI000DA80C36|nr:MULTISPECIES: hypothetical protein [unclassified Curtobacterium]PZE25667.1 hypothetical protein DEI86_10235 [Curtobacterium sp. MCBD17_028]PZE78465.1 hypothetical protein DEI82_01505 [Curtobacterium sp. MCBD17_019]